MRNVLTAILLAAHGMALTRAAMEDHRWKRVRRFHWWIAGVAGVTAAGMRQNVSLGRLWELALFGMMQYCLFVRAYGKADCHAFFCCGIGLAVLGGGMEEHLLMALTAFGILAGVQVTRRNVDGRGNLRKPVAFVPYVALAYFVCLSLLALRNLGIQ